MFKTKSGFTIVELLIVIVVIAILAAISIVAYNGIQQRARNSQTVAAVSAWAKAINLFVADKGYYPVNASCLGDTYTYGVSGTDSTGYQCRQDSTSAGVNVNNAFFNEIAPYSSSRPQASTSATYLVSSTNWYRGAYYWVATPHRIDYVLEGVVDCPNIGGLIIQSRFTTSNTTRCITNFGDS